MKTFLIIVAILVVAFAVFVLVGYYMNKRRLKRLLDERDNLNLTTLHGKNRAKVLNKKIDIMYGFTE